MTYGILSQFTTSPGSRHGRGVRLRSRVNVLFDLDGTLTDPREGILSCFKHALGGVGCEIPSDSALEACIGPPLHVSLSGLLGPDKQRAVPQAHALFRERFAERGLFENAVYPGIPQSLARLKAMGASLHVVTSKPGVFAMRILEHFRLHHYFTSVNGSELDGARSNKAELIAHVLQVHSLVSGATVMAGDRAHDILGARTNGIFAVGVLWGYGSTTELVAAGVQLVCERPSMLARIASLQPGHGSARITE